MNRLTNLLAGGLRITHGAGEILANENGYAYIPAQEGDTTLTITGGENGFEISLCRRKCNDRDNYPDWALAEITLNEDEAREVLLALTVWLEQRT